MPGHMGELMAHEPSDEERQAWKRAAAEAAVNAEVRSGMVVGLGTGTTAYFVVQELARLIRDAGLQIRGIPTSLETERLAQSLGIPLTDLHETPDVDIDGADEIDPEHNLTKGAGGAMTREKCVAVAARRFVVVADAPKLVTKLRWPVPVEVLPFALPFVEREIQADFPGAVSVLRLRDGAPLTTDNGNQILDVRFPDDIAPGPKALARRLDNMTGLLEHGIFAGMRPRVYVAGPTGVRVLDVDAD